MTSIFSGKPKTQVNPTPFSEQMKHSVKQFQFLKVQNCFRQEERVQSVQNVLNITEGTIHVGFWFTVKDIEVSLGVIGDRLVDPLLVWNDTLRDGPRDVQYFALTTDEARISVHL